MRAASKPRHGESSEIDFLDAAERLFAAHGYEGTKVRAIADAAGVNLGALHYYWGSKEALFRAVCERRLVPLVEERVRLLDQCLVDAQGGKPELAQVLRAGIAPMLRASMAGTSQFGALMARTLSDPSPAVREVMRDIYDESVFRYVRLLRQACDQLDTQVFFRRLHIVLGAAQHANSARDRVRTLSRGEYDVGAVDALIDELVRQLTRVMADPVSAA